MKKHAILIAAGMILLFAGAAWPAGSCTQTMQSVLPPSGDPTKEITLACTGDASAGTIPTQTIEAHYLALLKYNYYLYQVIAYPTAGGPAPDPADVTVSMDGQDLLGGKGVNLIHNTATYDTFPYSTFMSAYRFPLITNTVTLNVANQATGGAKFTLKLIFVR